MDKLVTISLFSGCGGGDIGASRVGAKIILANDNDANAIATYQKYKHLVSESDIEITHKDIENVKAFPHCDLAMGCYPCQSFTMGGPRSPDNDSRSTLYKQFARCLEASKAKYFVTENVAGLAWLNKGKHLKDQLDCFHNAGKGYNVSVDLLDTKDYGIPQTRRRIIIVGIRKDIALFYSFPAATYGPAGSNLLPFASHGDVIEDLPIDGSGEYYDYSPEPFSWWYMSRNRKRRWEEPSYAIQANWRHVPIHPASPKMHMVESKLEDGFKQRWEFTKEYDHLESHPNYPKLENPRRLSWRECAAIQTFPEGFEPVGSMASKYLQIGNATPPLLMEVIVKGLVDGTALHTEPSRPKNKSIAKLAD